MPPVSRTHSFQSLPSPAIFVSACSWNQAIRELEMCKDSRENQSRSVWSNSSQPLWLPISQRACQQAITKHKQIFVAAVPQPIGAQFIGIQALSRSHTCLISNLTDTSFSRRALFGSAGSYSSFGKLRNCVFHQSWSGVSLKCFTEV